MCVFIIFLCARASMGARVCESAGVCVNAYNNPVVSQSHCVPYHDCSLLVFQFLSVRVVS